MTSPAVRWIATVSACLAWAAGAARAEQAKAPSFYATFLAPRIDARLHEESAAALDFTDSAANPWTRDPLAVERVQKRAIRATRGALKRYAIETLGIDAWSLPLEGLGSRGLAALRTDSGGARLRLGFAHLAPRAEVLIPTTGGRVAVSLDARGHVGTWFETRTSDVRLGISLDPLGHEGTLGLTRRF